MMMALRQAVINRKHSVVFLSLSLLLVTSCSAPGYIPVYSASYDIKPLQSTYEVRKEDTLFSIAWRHRLDYKELARINGIYSPYRIYPGQVLRLHFDNVDVVEETKYNNKNTAKNNKSKYDKATSKKQYSDSQSSERGLSGKSSGFNEKWIWPASGKVVLRYVSGKAGQNGLDVLGSYGDPVRAAASGKVIYSGGGLIGYGNLIIIEHNDELLSAYAHNSRLLSKESDYVLAGQKIAEIGSSGTNRSKLYFEIRHKGIPIDPREFLPRHNH